MYEAVWLPRLRHKGANNATTTPRRPVPPVLGPPNQLTPHALLQMVAQGGHGPPLPPHIHLTTLQQALQHLNQPPAPGAPELVPDPDPEGAQSDGQASEASNQDDDAERPGKQERLRIRANWDPSYPNEKVSWYDEYIQRHGPTVANWFEPARRKDNSDKWVNVDARGVALYRPDNFLDDPAGLDTLLAISPLDDGGICIWDVNGTRGKKGSIFAKSKPGLLFVDGPQADNNRASKRVDSGVTECVSVDNQRHRAFFAVQSRELPSYPAIPHSSY